MSDRQIAIIGAGPYGLGAAARLRAAGTDVQVLGDPMSYWRGMPRGMLLRSPYQASSISDARGSVGLPAYEREIGRVLPRPIPLDEFVRYGEWVQARVAPDIDTRRVRRVEQSGAGFKLILEDGDELTADRVVMATGLESFERPHPVLSKLPSELVSHTAALAEPGEFEGKRVVVVGGGQSATESTALLHEAGAHVEMLVRAPRIRWLTRTAAIHKHSRFLRPLFYPDTDVGPPGLNQIAARPGLFRAVPRAMQPPLARRCIRPAASAWLVDRTADVPISTGRSVCAAEPTGSGVHLELDDGSMREVDHVILGTGFELDVREHPLLAPDLQGEVQHRDGYPLLGRGYESSITGLHFIGAISATSFGPIMRFVCGTWYTSASLERYLAEHRRAGRLRPGATVRSEVAAVADAQQSAS
ncbi:MAG TPA: FAD-dependent oxidoreductase [Thermoleophilaceae bacterium]|jgi:thioredoxin reductase